MPDLDRRRLAVLAVVAVVVVAFGLRQMGGRGEPPSAAAEPAALPVQPAAGSSSGGQVTVHVAGAVRDPGVYRLRGGQRVDDAVQRAGGATAKADLSAVNLAAPLEDGRQILVPLRAQAGAAPAAGSAPGAAPVKVNLNTATAEQLDTLAGVGPATAAKILAHREQHGAFGSVEDLADVPGIGERRLAALRELVTV
jgi:competence protein ComEA